MWNILIIDEKTEEMRSTKLLNDLPDEGEREIWLVEIKQFGLWRNIHRIQTHLREELALSSRERNPPESPPAGG